MVKMFDDEFWKLVESEGYVVDFLGGIFVQLFEFNCEDLQQVCEFFKGGFSNMCFMDDCGLFYWVFFLDCNDFFNEMEYVVFLENGLDCLCVVL